MGPLETAARIVVDLLVARDYDVIESMTRGRLLSASDLENAVTEYGATLVPPPDEAWKGLLDVVEIEGASPPKFHVVVPIWTAEEGRSDLTLELHLEDAYGGAYDIQVLNLHVL